MNTRNCHNANFEQDVLYSKYFNKCKYTIFSESVVRDHSYFVIRITTCNIDDDNFLNAFQKLQSFP